MNATTSVVAAAALAVAGALPARAQMAPLAQYLMPDRAAEIALARSAAPPAIGAQADVLVLGRRGYSTAVHGTNGFVCVVERAWMAPFDNPQFWNPRIRGPICYNPPAARSIVPLMLRRTALVLSGLSKDAVLDSLRRDAHHPAAPGAMAFMLSKGGHIDDVSGPWRPHLMVYVATADSAGWGADVAGSPVMGQNPQFAAEGQPIVLLMVPVLAWSDGSAAPPLHSSPNATRPRGQ